MSILKFLFFGFLFTPFLFRLDTAQVKQYETILIKPGNEYRQTFASGHNGLYRINIFAHNPKLSYQEPLLFRLIEDKTQEKIAEIPFSGLNVGTNMWVPFQFPVQKNSLGKKYSFFLVMPKESSKGSSLEFRRVASDPTQKNMELFLREEKQTGTLMFKSYYKASIWQFSTDVLANFWQKVSGDKIFLIIYSGSMLLVFLIAIYTFIIE